MNTADATPPALDEAQRLAARVRPAGNEVMYQQWRDLPFLHWEYPAAADGFLMTDVAHLGPR